MALDPVQPSIIPLEDLQPTVFDMEKAAKKLKSKQLDAIRLLISGEKIEAIAINLGVNKHQLRAWLKDPVFNFALNESKADLFKNLIFVAINGAVESLAHLREIASDPNVSPYVRVQAASTLVEYGYKLYAQHEVESRLIDIEARLDGD